MKNLIMSNAPHIHSGNSTKKIMMDVLIALVPAAVAAVVIFGMKALIIEAVCVVACVAGEYIYNVITKKDQTVNDLTAAITGLILALNLDSDMPWYLCILGSLFAIIAVKCLCGGLGKNFANPAASGKVLATLIFSFMTSAVATGETPSMMDMLIGNRAGAIGETCIIALLIGYVYLVVRDDIKWYVPFAFVATVFVLSFVFTFSLEKALYEIFGGALFMAAIFMATDYVTTPITVKGKVVFAVGAGIITFVICHFLNYAEGAVFAILIMNMLVPYIEKTFRNHPLGSK
ncbi:MAG: RnfABCDGE type electron transport complex subunit D [Erysipelotrichaceae bacterium]|nr:RnfABCDGE type electron transport complex subunit D [Erysipelotrichaceae bacterium]